MARPWSEVVADPNFQSLAPDAKEAARNAYFQQNVLPNIPQGANASAIRLKFDQGTKPTVAQSPSLLMAPVGGAEMLLQGATGALASVPAGLAYGGAALARAAGADVNPAAVQSRVQQALTYQPMSDSGKAGDQQLAELARPVVAPVAQAADRAATAVGTVSPTAETYLREAPAAFQAAAGVLPMAGLARPAFNAATDLAQGAANTARNTASAVQRRFAAPPGVEDVLRQTYADTPQSMGAAAAAPAISNISPELRQAISKAAQRTGGVINPDVLNRHIEADSLPVKVQLTEGQATRDPVLFSEEQNLRGKHTDLAKNFNEQNANLVENIQAIRDRVGPDVFSTNAAQHGDTLIDAYKQLDKARNADIDAKYQALREAAGGNFPVDSQALLDSVRSKLSKQLLTHDAPPGIMRTLEDLAARDQMTFEQFESLRTNLARIQRSMSADGNVRYAAGLIRDSMEELPLKSLAQDSAAPSSTAEVTKNIQGITDDWSYRKGGLWDSSFFVGKRTDGGVQTAEPFAANVYKLTPDDSPLVEPVMRIHDEKPMEFNFENIRTGYGGQDNKFGITGTGHAREVISQVSQRFVGALQKFEPPMMIYSAEEPSRISLYERLTKNLSVDNYKGYRLVVPGENRAVFAAIRQDNIAGLQKELSAQGIEITPVVRAQKASPQSSINVDATKLKSLADTARMAARSRFQALEADPAYKAAINGTVDPDKFVRKFIVNGSRDDVATMAQNIAGNDPARQTLSVAVMDHLRDAAGIGADYKGSFKQAAYNKALQALDPKLLKLVDPKTAEQLQTLGNVAHNIQVEPPGGTVNRSNTLTAGMSNYASSALEHIANAKAGVPVGTGVRAIAQHLKYGSRIRQAIQPGAGLDQLKPLTAYEQMLSAARAKAAQQVSP